MKKHLLMISMIMSIPIAASFAAVNNSAGIIFPELTSGVGARAEAMAGAFTAVADDASAVYWNPAGLSRINKIKVSAAFDKWFMDSSYQNILAAFPSGPGVIGFDIFFMNYGTFNRVNESGGLPGGSINPYDLTVLGGYGMPLGRELSAGMSVKFSTQVIDTFSYTGLGLDLAMLYKIEAFAAGLTLQNIGTAGSYSMPMAVRGGASMLALSTREHKLTIAADMDYIFRDAPYASAGAEYVFLKMFSLRAGYRLKFGTNNTGGMTGLSAGAGVAFNDYSIDYAYVPFGELGTTHRVTLNMDFSLPSQEVEMLKPARRVTDSRTKKPEKTTKELFAMLAQGGSYENAGNLDAAEKQYREILDADFNYAEAWKRLGAVMVKKKNNVEAFRCFQAYLKLKPDDSAVKSWLKKNSRE
jgi:hypothetical protein